MARGYNRVSRKHGERIWREMKLIRKQNGELKQLVRRELQNLISAE
jgi:hypothetical protein